MKEHYREINEYIDNHKEEMIEKWSTLVNLEGHYNERENVEKAMKWLKNEFEEIGVKCTVKEIDSDHAGVLIGVLGAERQGEPVLFSGHIDTVHYTGTFGGENPFYIENGLAFGPGVLDMKGGIIITLYVLKALNHIGFNERPIKVLFVGEEESDHVENNVDELVKEESKGAICAFNMETGNIENRLCVGRKTQCTFFVTVKGIGGHAGNEFFKGRNALLEAMYMINELVKWTDLQKQIFVTPTVINSGEHSSSIPNLCTFAVDVRFPRTEDIEPFIHRFEQLIKKPSIDGTLTEYRVNIAKLHPFGPTEQVMKMFDFVNKVVESNGYDSFGQIELGGSTDAGSIANAGVPVLCSCGVIGEYNHSTKEYAVVQSVFDRSKIFAAAVTELSTF